MSPLTSCPDWRRLLRHRLEAGRREPAGWGDAVTHLSTCRACRAEALAIDPTVIFVAGRTTDLERSELDEIKRSVNAVRRAREVEEAFARPVGVARKIGAAAALLAFLLLLPPAAVDLPDGLVPAGIPGLEELESLATGTQPSPVVSPLIEPLDRPLARIYQLGQEDLSLVMVVDESLDV